MAFIIRSINWGHRPKQTGELVMFWGIATKLGTEEIVGNDPKTRQSLSSVMPTLLQHMQRKL